MRKRSLALFAACVLFATLSLYAPACALASGPVISNTSPADGAVITGPFRVGALIEDPNNIATATVSVAGVKYRTTLTYHVDWVCCGGWCYEVWPVTNYTRADIFADIPDLPPGTHTVIVRAQDSLGNVSTRQWSITRASHISFSDLRPAPSSIASSVSEVSARISGTHLDPASIVMMVDGAIVPHTWVPDAQAGSGVAVHSGILPPGTRSVRLSATDIHGNLPTPHSWSFIIDKSPPSIHSVIPAPGTVLVDSLPVNLSVELRDAVRLDTASMRLFLNGNRLPAAITAWWPHTGATITWSGPIDPGTHTARLEAADSAGNTLVHSWSFTMPPRAGPTFTVLHPGDGHIFWWTGPVWVQATAHDPTGMAPTATVSVNGVIYPVTVGHPEIWYHPPGAYDGQFIGHDYTALDIFAQLPDLPVGTRSITLTVADSAGNTSSVSRSVTERPSFRWLNPLAGSVTTQTPIPVRVNIADPRGIDPASVRIDYRTANLGRPAGEWVSIPSQYDAFAGWISGVFNAPETENRYEIRFTAAGTPDNVASVVTNVFVDSVKPKMQLRGGNPECSACHGVIHATGNCAPCHGWGCGGAGCHSDHGSDFYENCLRCHGATGFWAQAPGWKGSDITASPHRHTPILESERHATTSSPQCGLCHARGITTEHEGLVTRAGQPFTCITCHAGPSGAVPAFAILPRSGSSGVSGQSLSSPSTLGQVSGQQVSAMSVTQPFACETCHVGAGHDALHDGGLAPFPPSCGACHVSNLIPEHNNDCALCHAANVDITISTAVANRDVRCNSCHPGLHVRTWGAPDYYAPDTRAGPGGRGDYLRWVGDNPTYPGVHGGYKATTAKCGVCHSVHRARGDGIFLLNTSDATCTGCHRAGATTVTNVVITWETGGPHGSGDNAACTSIGCHLNNPHGVGGSQYQIISQKLLNPATDALFTTALASPATSGITAIALSGTVWPDSTESLVRTGYNCNLCHTSSMLAVVGSWTVDGETRWWAEDRHRNIGDHAPVSKTGHPGVGSTAATSRAGLPIAWGSCHRLRELPRPDR